MGLMGGRGLIKEHVMLRLLWVRHFAARFQGWLRSDVVSFCTSSAGGRDSMETLGC